MSRTVDCLSCSAVRQTTETIRGSNNRALEYNKTIFHNYEDDH